MVTQLAERRTLRIVNHRVPGPRGYLKGSYLRSPLDIAIS
jgi:hypothetical protein